MFVCGYTHTNTHTLKYAHSHKLTRTTSVYVNTCLPVRLTNLQNKTKGLPPPLPTFGRAGDEEVSAGGPAATAGNAAADIGQAGGREAVMSAVKGAGTTEVSAGRRGGGGGCFEGEEGGRGSEGIRSPRAVPGPRRRQRERVDSNCTNFVPLANDRKSNN